MDDDRPGDRVQDAAAVMTRGWYKRRCRRLKSRIERLEADLAAARAERDAAVQAMAQRTRTGRSL